MQQKLLDCELKLIACAQRIKTLENLTSDLSNQLATEKNERKTENERDKKLLTDYETQLTEQREIYKRQSQEYENVKNSLSRLRTENTILWIADGVIGTGLILYGLFTGDMPLIITGGAMAVTCGLHFVFDIF
jgi:hypothetical protein